MNKLVMAYVCFQPTVEISVKLYLRYIIRGARDSRDGYMCRGQRLGKLAKARDAFRDCHLVG